MNNSSSSASVISLVHDCSIFPTPRTISLSNSVVKVALLLPLSLAVLYFGFLRRQQPLRRTHSHADVLAFHMALLELVGALALFLYFGSAQSGAERVRTAAALLGCVVPPGELLILTLTCVDRYLAVVHPITYLQLRQGKGIVARNVSVALVWMVSCSFIGFAHLYLPEQAAVEFICLLTVSLLVVIFCSTAVLCVLLRPQPGDSHGKRIKVDQSKARALKIMVTIMFVQLLWSLGFLVMMLIRKMSKLGREEKCLVLTSLTWLNMPCSLVSPLLFLQSKRHG